MSSWVNSTWPEESVTRSGTGIESVYVRQARMPRTVNPKSITRTMPWTQPLLTTMARRDAVPRPTVLREEEDMADMIITMAASVFISHPIFP